MSKQITSLTFQSLFAIVAVDVPASLSSSGIHYEKVMCIYTYIFYINRYTSPSDTYIKVIYIRIRVLRTGLSSQGCLSEAILSIKQWQPCQV